MGRNSIVVIAELLTIAALVLAGIFSFGGLSLKKELDDRYLALIDASDLTSTVAGETYHGLPDSHDFSRHKDVFALYVYGYCSGRLADKTKDDLSRWEVTFCSRPMAELFDQYRLWKVWGVDLASPRNAQDSVEKSIGVTAIKRIPMTIMGVFTLAVAGMATTVLVGFMSYFFTKWGVIVAAIVSTLSSFAALLVAALSQSLYPTLVRRTNDHAISTPSTKGTLHSQSNQRQLTIFWLVGVLSTVASISFVIGAFRAVRRAGLEKHSSSSSNKKSGSKPGVLGGIVQQTTDRFLVNVGSAGAYRKIEEGGSAGDKDRLMAGNIHGRGNSDVELASREESRSGRVSEEVSSSAARGLRDEESRYEPMRHRGEA